MKRKPVVGKKPHSNLPVSSGTSTKKWTFSFRFWRQIDFFGLDKSEPKWFVSLLGKLNVLSTIELDRFLEDGNQKNHWRYHKIDWNKKNIPIQREDVVWLDKDYLENEEDFPFYQFQVSMALGRIVGFWDENQVFNILLLDPLHNIQPSKDYDYKVDACSQLSCMFSSLLEDIKKITKSTKCENTNCGFKEKLDEIPTKANYGNVLMHHIEDDVIEKIRYLIEKGDITCAADLIEWGIEVFDEKVNSESEEILN